MVADISAGCTLKSTNEPQSGIRITILETEATADDGDWILVNTVTGLSGIKTVLHATATQDIVGTAVTDAMKIDSTDKTKIYIGGSTDNKLRTILVHSI